MNPKKTYLSNSEAEKARQAMRKKLIAMLMTWKPAQFGTFDPEAMRYRPNMQAIYDWVNTYGHKKPRWLNKYSYEDLVILVSQVTKITGTK